LTPKADAHSLGRWGEVQAGEHLSRNGWRILARNYRFGRREVDLVIRKADLVAFVEVKTRAGEGYGSPEEAITRLKRREIEAVAKEFLIRHRLSRLEVRFDVFAILVGPGRRVLRVEHVEDAWRPGWP
jgi:putative endonuclease